MDLNDTWSKVCARCNCIKIESYSGAGHRTHQPDDCIKALSDKLQTTREQLEGVMSRLESALERIRVLELPVLDRMAHESAV